MHELNIEWEVSKQNLRQELVSKDRRWHIAKTQIGNEGPKFFMSNYDLLLMPHGTGADYRECFTTFIADCDKFIAIAQKIPEEALQEDEKLLLWYDQAITRTEAGA